MNYAATVEDAATSDLDSQITDEFEELQARHTADALIGPLGALLQVRREAAQRAGTAVVNNSPVELPAILNMAEMRLIEGYLEDVQDTAVLVAAQRLVAEAQAARKNNRTSFQKSLIDPGGWRRPKWASVKKWNAATGIVERVQQTGPVNDVRDIARRAAEEAGVLVNGNVPSHWGNPGAPTLNDHPAIHRASVVSLNRETPGFRDESGLVAEVNIRGYLRLTPLLRIPDGVPENERPAAIAAVDNMRMQIFQMLVIPGSYAEYLVTHNISVAEEPSWRPIIRDVIPTADSTGLARALASAGFTVTDADEVVDYIWSWIRYRIHQM